MSETSVRASCRLLRAGATLTGSARFWVNREAFRIMALAPDRTAQPGQPHRARFDERPEGPATTPSTSSARFRLGGSVPKYPSNAPSSTAPPALGTSERAGDRGAETAVVFPHLEPVMMSGATCEASLCG